MYFIGPIILGYFKVFCILWFLNLKMEAVNLRQDLQVDGSGVMWRRDR